MIRKLGWALGLTLGLSARVLALGLGEIELNSALSEPLDATVPLVNAADVDLPRVRIKLASHEAFERAGIARPNFLTKLRFELETGPDGRPVIHITSREPVREPYLDFLLQVSWSGGQLLREYTVLVDPPAFAPPGPPPTPSPPVSQQPAPVEPPAPPPTPRDAAARRYGPVTADDTLWSIALEVGPYAPKRTMLAILRKNPEAFINGNINGLKTGYVLRLPSRAEIESMRPRAALDEVARQNAAWERQQPLSPPAPAADDAAETVGTEAAQDTPAVLEPELPVSEGRLQLIAPEDEPVEGAAEAGGAVADGQAVGALAELSEELSLALEAAEVQRQRTDDLRERLTELETRLEDMHRLLELKDQELAQLQEDLTPSPAPQAPAPAPPRPEPVAWWQRPEVWGGALVLAVLLLALALRRRRQQAEDVAADAEPLAEAPAAAAAPAAPPAQAPAPAAPEPVAQAGEPDPLAEADVLLAYGRHGQAETLLRGALEMHPGDAELRVKLLEVYHAARKPTEFGEVAVDLLAGLDSPDDPSWRRVAAMGQELDPDNPLYAEDNGAEPATAPGPEPAPAPAPEGLEERRPLADETADNTLEFEPGVSGDDGGGPDTAPAAPGGAGGLFEGVDEVATKLDLARAYADMGDPDGALTILDEVIAEGNEEQVREAEGLKAELSNPS